MSSQVWCPYDDCGFTGTDEQVDEHRATGVHNDQPQAGSNLRHDPRSLRSQPGTGPEKWVPEAIAEQEAYLERMRQERKAK